MPLRMLAVIGDRLSNTMEHPATMNRSAVSGFIATNAGDSRLSTAISAIHPTNTLAPIAMTARPVLCDSFWLAESSEVSITQRVLLRGFAHTRRFLPGWYMLAPSPQSTECATTLHP